MECPTVKIVSGDSFVVINEEDFNEETMTIFVEEAETTTDDDDKSDFDMEGATISILRVVADDIELDLDGATLKDDIIAKFDALEGDDRDKALAAVKEEIED